MGKLEYLEALRRAMAGLPTELQAKTLAFYEQRFVDAANAGVAEQAVADDLGEPQKIAMTLRANAHLASLQPGAASKTAEPRKPRSAADLVRVSFSAVGLSIFNLFMVVPAAVFGSLLAALLAAGLGFYIGGIAITASGLAGATELVLGGPFASVAVSTDTTVRDIDRTRTRVTINESGVHVDQERMTDPLDTRGAGGILIESDVNPDARTMQTLFGFSLVLGGIALLLVGLGLTRYTFAGIKRYVHMNIALLKGA